MPVPNERILVDTGPLVAVLNAADEHHHWARDVFSRLSPPVYTCESVLSETQFLLHHRGRNTLAVLDWIRAGVIELGFDLQKEVDRVRALQRSYQNLPMDLADACLVRMSELHRRSLIVTTDEHFRIYRRNRRQVIPLLAP